MPVKHVHFPGSDSPSTPSPTYSTSSLPSSGGPSTPPPVMGFGPHQYYPLPGTYIINPVLGVREILPYHWDISYPTSSVTHRVPISPTLWDEPATKPGMPALIIVSSWLPWTITITSTTKGCHVTVRDVIDGLYHTLRANVTPAEFGLLPSPEEKQRVSATYKRRYKRMPDIISYEKEKAGGLKRVDFLGERTTFMGLTSTKEGGHVWKLVVSGSTQ